MFGAIGGLGGVEGSGARLGGGARAGPATREATARCTVCGSPEVRRDAVEHGGLLLLAECAHCDHRWTRREIVSGAVVRSAQPVRNEAASVADAA
jgi:hypothetical protein